MRDLRCVIPFLLTGLFVALGPPQPALAQDGERVEPSDALARAASDGATLRIRTRDFELKVRDPSLRGNRLLFGEAEAVRGHAPVNISALEMERVVRVEAYQPRGLMGTLIGAVAGVALAEASILLAEADNREACTDFDRSTICAPPLPDGTKNAVRLSVAGLGAGIGFWMGRTRFAWTVVYGR